MLGVATTNDELRPTYGSESQHLDAVLGEGSELGDYTNLSGDPRVDLVNDEARSWLTRTDKRFDVIQISLIDTWAASAANSTGPTFSCT